MALCGRNKGILELEVKGDGFPTGNVAANVIFFSTLQQNMYVNYNDGSDEEVYRINDNARVYLLNPVANNASHTLYDNKDVSNLPTSGDISYLGKVFEDGNTGNRTMTIRFDNFKAITRVASSFTYNWIGEFPKNILNYTNIEVFYLQYMLYITKLPQDLITLTNINNLTLSNCFYNQPYMRDYIPQGFLNLKLTRLGLSNVKLGDGLRDGKNTNLQNVFLLKDTLNYIDLEACRLDDNISQDISNSFSKCVNLKTMYIGFNYFTTVPSFINRINSLTLLRIGGGASFDDKLHYWGDLSDLVNLIEFQCPISSTITTDTPPYLKDMPKLTKFNVVGSYKTQQRWNEFIYNLYEYITTNAIIDHDDTQSKVSCRNMDVLASRAGDVYIIQGTYQQPTGYTQGVSNGTPTSQLEKIWVLEHQYNVSVSYTDNR